MWHIDSIESSSNSRIILIDFSYTLDPKARITNNCSVNNHYVLDIFFVLSNFCTVTNANGLSNRICDTNV